MALSAAVQEAYASGDALGVVLLAAEITHPTFAVPIRVVAGVDGPTGVAPEDRVVLLPTAVSGIAVAHIPCAFEFTPPGADQDGPTDAKVRIDNVSDLLEEHLRGAVGYDAPVLITFRTYIVTPGELDQVTGPDDEIDGLELRVVTLNAESAEGTLQYPDGRQVSVPTGPNAFFTRDEYPGLF